MFYYSKIYIRLIIIVLLFSVQIQSWAFKKGVPAAGEEKGLFTALMCWFSHLF